LQFKNKQLTKCGKIRGRAATWHVLQKKDNGWMYIMDEKRRSLYKCSGRK